MAITFITPVEVSPGTADAWTDCDVSAHIPSGAVGVILHVVNTTGNTRGFGLRKNGSTDARTNDLVTISHIWCMVGVDANRIFEAFHATVATDIDIYLVGYFEGADAHFFTNAVDKSTATTGAYEDVDISGDLQGADDAIGAILEATETGNRLLALRPNGSSDDRYREITRHAWFIVGLDAGHVFEQKISTTALDLFLVGYIKSTANFVFEDPAVDMSLGVNDVWTDLTALPAGALGVLLEVITDSATPVFYGLRQNGSSEDIVQRSRHCVGLLAADGSQLVEGYQDLANMDFWRLGYVTTPAAAAGRPRLPSQGMSQAVHRAAHF